MKNIQKLYDRLHELEEIIEILVDEGTSAEYVEPFELQLVEVKTAIESANVVPKNQGK